MPRARAPVHTAGRATCSDAMPPQAAPKSPASRRLRSGVHGEWSLTTRSTSPSASAAHSASRCARLADRRAALERRRPVGHLLGGEGQVVRAGLDGDPHALGPGPPQQRQGVGVGEVDDVRPRPGVAGGRDQPADRRLLRRPRPGGQEAGVARARRARGRRDDVGVLGVRDQQPVEGRQLGERGPEARVVQRRELGDAGVEQEALEADDARLVQRPQLVEVAGDGAAPERDVGRDLAVRRLPFHVQRVDGRRRRDRVEGHVDDRGDAAGDGGPRRGGEALPLGAPGLVDVHVAVDQAGEQHLVVGEGDGGGRGVVEGGDRGDPAAGGVHGGGALAVGQDHPPGADDEAHAVTLRRRPASARRRPARPGAARSPTRSSPSRPAGAAGRRPPRSGRLRLGADVHRGCIGPRGHRWQPGGLARAQPDGGVQQRPPVPHDASCRSSGPVPRRAAEQHLLGGGEDAAGPSSAASSATWWARAATTVGSSREVERCRRRRR